MQIGNSSYKPKRCQWYYYLNYDESIDLIGRSDIVICHGGSGTIIDVLLNEKPLIICPRLSQYHEAIDDHELELAEKLSISQRAILVRDMKNLLIAINSATNKNFPTNSNKSLIINYLNNYINDQ